MKQLAHLLVRSDRLLPAFYYYSFVLLLVTGLAKLGSRFASTPILKREDPILGLSNGDLLVVVGIIEVAAAVLLVAPVRRFAKCVGIWVVASGILSYRLAETISGVEAPCPCLGQLINVLPATQAQIQMFLTATAIVLFVGSSIFLTAMTIEPKES